MLKLGTKLHHDMLLKGIDSLEAVGCFGLTELGFGESACFWLASADQLASRELQHHLDVQDAEQVSICALCSPTACCSSIPGWQLMPHVVYLQADPQWLLFCSSVCGPTCCIVQTPADSMAPAVATAGLRESMKTKLQTATV